MSFAIYTNTFWTSQTKTLRFYYFSKSLVTYITILKILNFSEKIAHYSFS